LKVLFLFGGFLGQGATWGEAEIVLCLDEKDRRLGEVDGAKEAILKGSILFPGHGAGSERHQGLYPEITFTGEEGLDAAVRAAGNGEASWVNEGPRLEKVEGGDYVVHFGVLELDHEPSAVLRRRLSDHILNVIARRAALAAAMRNKEDVRMRGVELG